MYVCYFVALPVKKELVQGSPHNFYPHVFSAVQAWNEISQEMYERLNYTCTKTRFFSFESSIHDKNISWRTFLFGWSEGDVSWHRV